MDRGSRNGMTSSSFSSAGCRCLYRPVIDTITSSYRSPVISLSYILNHNGGPMGIASHILYMVSRARSSNLV
jgi:hypothetical protein